MRLTTLLGCLCLTLHSLPETAQPPDKPFHFRQPVDEISWSPKGDLIAVVSGPPVMGASELIILDSSSGKTRHNLSLSQGVQATSFSRDGSRLACAVDDGHIIVCSPYTASTERKFPQDSVKAIAFDSSGRELAAVGADGFLVIWDLDSGKPKCRVRVSKDYAFAVAYSPDGREIVTGGDYDGTIKWWNAKTCDRLRAKGAHKEAVDSIEFSRSGQWMLTGSWDDTAKLWDTRTDKLVGILRGHSFNVWTVAFDPSSQVIATVSSELKIWDSTRRKCLKTLPISSMTAAFSPDGKHLAFGRGNRLVIVETSLK